ncbi:hypothetical protein CNMCM6457_004930 [Aspergillus fumigatiaffinis]|nr:hypothetical protein CNMCM6457_004930 [Aspergillus fumigatiaffinis]
MNAMNVHSGMMCWGQFLGNIRLMQHPVYRKQQRREPDTGYYLGACVMRIVEAHGSTGYAKNAEGEEVEPGEEAVAAMAVEEVEGWKC